MTKIQWAKLAQLVHGETFIVLKSLAGELTDGWMRTPIEDDDEFKCLKNALAKEYKAEGIRQFLRAIEDSVNEKTL